MNTYIFVGKSEYEEYKLKARYSNKIKQFWKSMLRALPLKLRKEANNKFTDLVEDPNHQNFKITGAIPFHFKTRNGSEDLNSALKEFTVYVERPTKEALEWKEKFKLLSI